MTDHSHTLGFRTVMRGYETGQVDRTVVDLQQALAAARTEAAESGVQVAKLQARVDDLAAQVTQQQQRVRQLEEEREHSAPPSFAELGERIGLMLSLAEEEAAGLRDRARAEADALLAEAREKAQRRTDTADRHAAEVTSKAEADATALVEGARREADDILDHADREATARREEAEAVFEHQRARAAAAAADFEKTLAERRDRAAEEFEAQMHAHEDALVRAEERLASVEAEAQRVQQEAQEHAEAILRGARDEAATLLEQARGNAERIRRESQRELTAATARRDAITVQLHNVRQMLATLGAGQLADPFAEPDPQATSGWDAVDAGHAASAPSPEEAQPEE